MNSRWPIVNLSNIWRFFENSVNIWWIYDISRRACGGHSRDFPGLCCGKGAAKAQEWQQQAHRKLIKYLTFFWKFVEYWWIYDILRWPIVNLSNIWRFFRKIVEYLMNLGYFRVAHRKFIKYSTSFRKFVEYLMILRWACGGHSRACRPIVNLSNILFYDLPKIRCVFDEFTMAHCKFIKYSMKFRKIFEYLMNSWWACSGHSQAFAAGRASSQGPGMATAGPS